MNYQEKCQWLSEFYGEAAKTGRKMEFCDARDGWIHGSGCGPCVFSNPKDWRFKPESSKKSPALTDMIEQPKHTPGPWKPAGRMATHILDANRRMIADAPHPNGMPSHEGYSNRDLICAAPELLEALKAVLNASWDGPLPDYARKIAIAAIAKAEGRGE